MDKYFTRIFVSIFGLVGLVFLTVAFFSVRAELKFRAGAVRVPGTVVDLAPTSGSKGGTLYKPVFEFTDNNDVARRVTGSVASNPPSHRRGEAVTVLYQPANPEEAHLDSFMEAWFLPMIFGGLGSVFTAIAAGFVVFAVRNRRRRSWLGHNGMRVQARVDGVERDTGPRSDGRSAWRIIAQWQDPVSQRVFVFRSGAIWFDPTPYMQRTTVEVMVNPDNPRQYDMDIDFLPKAG
jgi:hypothetical protein